MRDHPSGPNPSRETSGNEAVERQAACEALHAECVTHRAEVEDQFPNVPQEAVHYLNERCSAPHVLPIAIKKLEVLLAENPTALDDPDFAAFELDFCLEEAENAAKLGVLETECDTGRELDTTIEGLRTQVEGTLTGANKQEQLAELIQAVEAQGDFPPEEKAALLQQLGLIASTLSEMSSVFTDEAGQAHFQTILNTTELDLGAASLGATFAPILEQVEASEAISDVDKVRLRHIVTGTDVQDTLAETVTNEDGSTQYRWSDRNQRELRAGVGGYATPTGRQMIEARAGDHIVTRDVTGWSGEDVGLVVELMHYWHLSESDGTTGFIENIYNIDFSILDHGGAFDPLTVNKFRQVISHLTSGFAGYDGDIENFENHRKLIRDQNRLLSQTMTTFGWENHQAGTTKVLIRLGFQDRDGNINLDVIKSFGDYTQRYYASGSPDNLDVVTFLSERHPDLVAPLTEDELAKGFLDTESDHA